MGLDGVDTSGRRAKAEGHVDASALVDGESVRPDLATDPPAHFSLRSFSIVGASQNLPLGKSAVRRQSRRILSEAQARSCGDEP